MMVVELRSDAAGMRAAVLDSPVVPHSEPAGPNPRMDWGRPVVKLERLPKRVEVGMRAGG